MRAAWAVGLAVVLAGAPAGRAVAAPDSGPVAAAVGTVTTSGGPLNTRTGPSTLHAAAGGVGNGARVTVSCQVFGQSVASSLRRTGLWDRLADGRYVADAYLRWKPARPALRWCGAGGVPVVPSVTGGGSVNVRSGPGTAYRSVGRVAGGSALAVVCQVWGERVSAAVTSHSWNRLHSGRYVADALVTWRPSRPTLPYCGQAAPTVPAATQAGFIARVAEPARQGRRQYGVPASVTIAQAILESGWGRSGLARRDHNYFGMKCHSSNPGGIALGCRSYATHECGGGKCWKTTASFRAYRNPAGSMTDHGRFLRVNPRYANAFKYRTDPNRFATEIHKAGYATSPTYATNLIRLMRQYNLYRYDR